MTTEHVLHHELLIPWLTTSFFEEDKGWLTPSASNAVNNAIDTHTGLLWPDAFDFLRGGNSGNERAWKELVEHQKKANGAAGAHLAAETVLKETLLGHLNQASSILDVLRSGIVVAASKPLRFTLWNRKPSTGDRTADIERNDYSHNILRTSAEVRVLTSPVAKDHGVGGPAGSKGAKANIRLDQGFHLNGIPYAYLELKEWGAGQSAKSQGRRQMAQDFVAAGIPALLAAHEEFELTMQASWPGLRASRKRLSDAFKRKAMAGLPLWFGKTAWRATMDSRELWLAGSAWDWLCMVDEALVKQKLAQHKGLGFDWARAYEDLVADLVNSFSRMPDLLLDQAYQHAALSSWMSNEVSIMRSPPWSQVQAHLQSLLGTSGLDAEIRLFGYPVQKKDSSSVSTFEIMAPRAPQRAAMGQIQVKLDEFYAHETEPDWIEQDLRTRLRASMPGLSREEVEVRVGERLRFRNGQESYSMLIQGAAGLGKTNIAVWTSLCLHDQLERDPTGRHTSQPMFDYIVVLTDRLDLRKNIAEEAELSNGSKGMVSEAKTIEDLADILSGNAPRGTGRIVVVNLQKFPSLREKIQQGDVSIRRNGGRIAFIIDEVHRSNQGKLNAETQDAFLEEVSQLSHDASSGQKKNLIIGLTASPTDAIMARFGRWQPGTGAGNPGCWTPHFAYGMTQAIEDGYVLDPLRGMVRLETTLDIDQVKTVSEADMKRKRIAGNVSLLEIYENEVWQRKFAHAFCQIFATTTMMSCRDKHNANRSGRGKAMITVPSVKAAITMQSIIKEELHHLAKNAQGAPWEKYADIVEDVADLRVFVLYSDPGKRATVAQRDTTGVDSGCGRLNPPVNGVNPTEEQIIDMFRCKDAKSDGNARNSIIIVVDKLLTGFDENTLHTIAIARNLSGVSLLQTMCRVNRTRPGKSNCLVIDASYDPNGGNGLGEEAARVFHRYGGLATSRLDGLSLMDQVSERRLLILKNPAIKATWKEWKKKGSTNDLRILLLANLADELEREAIASAIRREIGGYLSQQRLADPIMNLDEADRNEVFLDFLYRAHKALGNNRVDDKVPVQFTVRDVDAVANTDEPEPIITHRERERQTPEDRLVADMNEDPEAESMFEHLLDIQDLQEAKAKRVAILREFLAQLGEEIDTLADASQTVANDCRSLREHGLDPVEATEIFRKLVAGVKLSRVEGGKGRGLWVDQAPERRKLLDWIREPGRMDLAMRAWMTK